MSALPPKADMRGVQLAKGAEQIDNATGDSVRIRVISHSKCTSNPVFVACRFIECEVIFNSDKHPAHLIVR